MPLNIDLPNVRLALLDAAAYIQEAWIAAADASDMSPRQLAVYVGGLTQRGSIAYAADGNPYAVRVSNLGPLAVPLENGTPAYHLPERIDWASSPSAHKTQKGPHKGRYYLFIPFTHGAYRGKKGGPRAQARMMPSGVYRYARLLRPGQYLTGNPNLGGTRAITVPGLTPYVPRYARNIRPGYTHASKYERMVRRPARGGGSQYLTFRTMTQDSPGWHIPAQPGLHLVPKVIREVTPTVEAMLGAALGQDITVRIQQQLGGRP